MKVAIRKRVSHGEAHVSTALKVSAADALTEALRLVDEVEAIAMLVEAHLVETGPTIVHAAARLLARTARQLGCELCVLVDHVDARRTRRQQQRRARR